jgi:hypothetical protein
VAGCRRRPGRRRNSRDDFGAAAATLRQGNSTGVAGPAEADRYDPGRPNPFIAYAIACIDGELRRCLRDSSWRVHVSRTLKELALQVAKARDALTATLGRSSTLTGDYLGIASWLLPDAHLPAAAPGPCPRCASSWSERGPRWGGRPGKPPGPGRRRPVVRGRSPAWQPNRPPESRWLVVARPALHERPLWRLPACRPAASPRGWRCPAGVATAWSRPG